MNPEAIEKLIDNGRDSYESRLAAGQARMQQKEFKQAIEHFRRATGFKPERSVAWQQLGQALERNGESQAARTVWEKGLAAAKANGDKQAEKVMQVWIRRLNRTSQ
ncbi:MAG: tetratricopeptide repeat protein [Xanthomonadaceae bacterium]|nr:tetratricopeptide repeat protein [Xanthomonadaceae bacterium]